MERLQVQYRIIELMSRWVASVKGAAEISLTDLNKVSETILVPLLSEVYDLPDLRNLNTESANFPGIDLADDKARVAIQVTSTSTSKKINHTLTEFVKHELYKQYKHLIVYILVEKQKTYSGKGFNEIIDRQFQFDKEKDIRDYRDLLAVIQDFQIDRAKRILEILEANFLGEVQLYIPPKPPPPAELPEVGNLQPGSRMPFTRNAVFTGREDELKALAQSLLYDGQATVVTGTGGMGKSQLAVEFCYRYGRYFHGVHWLQANQDMQAEVADCGLEMGLKPWPETVPEQAQAVLNAWEQGGARLVVLDDAENPAVVQEWSPKLQNSRVMVTSLWQDWPADLGLALNKLKTLPREKSLVLLRKLAPKLEGAPDKELDDIADRLGDLPLALDLAGRYLKDRRTLSPKGFMEELDQVGSVLGHSALKDWVKHNPTKHEVNLAKTYLQSWDKLESKPAKQLFQACGYCAPNTPIPWAVLQASAEVEEADLDRGLGRLEDLGLVTLGDKGALVHPLLAEFARAVDEKEKGSAQPGLVSALGDLSNEALEKGLPELFKPLRPHMETAAKAAEKARLEGAGMLWNNLGSHLRNVAEYEGAKAAFERALAIDEAAFGPDHPKVATNVNNLGVVLQALGDYAGAKAAYERALAIDEAAFGPDHPEVATDVNNLGDVLRALGDYAGAKAAYARALAIWEVELGPDHPQVATGTNNLGSVLKAQGDYEGAKAAYARALAIWEVELGPDHPQVATGTNNLGSVLKAQGDYEGAKAFFERALAIDEAAFGPDHPNVATDVNNLGSVLQDLGDYAGAKAAYARALAIWEVELDPDHPQVGIGTNNLGSVLKDLGDYAGAKAAFERSLEIKRRYFPEDHPSIQLTLNNLASLEEEIKRQ
jgi:tetratricopeptide (TPR) repeat protein